MIEKAILEKGQTSPVNKISLLEKTSKLYEIFSKKIDDITENSGFNSAIKLKEYLDSLLPDVVDAFEFGMIHLINTGQADNCYAIINPYNPNKVLLIKRDYAENIIKNGIL